MNDRGISATYLMSALSKVTITENSSHVKLVKVPSWNRVNALLLHNTKPVTLLQILLTFRDTDDESELKRYLSKILSNKKYNVDLASLSDKNILYDFAKRCILM